MDNSTHSALLDLWQTKYDDDIIEFKEISDKLVALQMQKMGVDKITGRYYDVIYYHLAKRDGENLKINRTKYLKVRLNRHGDAVCYKYFFGKIKKEAFDSNGKRVKLEKKNLR